MLLQSGAAASWVGAKRGRRAEPPPGAGRGGHLPRRAASPVGVAARSGRVPTRVPSPALPQAPPAAAEGELPPGAGAPARSPRGVRRRGSSGSRAPPAPLLPAPAAGCCRLRQAAAGSRPRPPPLPEVGSFSGCALQTAVCISPGLICVPRGLGGAVGGLTYCWRQLGVRGVCR